MALPTSYETKKAKKPNFSLKKAPGSWIFFSSFALGAFVIYLIVLFYLVGLLVAIIPGLVRERAGVEQATKEKRLLIGAVSSAETELWEEGERKIRGHIIASSSELIAIYDIDLHRVRTMSRGSFEIRGLEK
ncbi:hypothetical protein [Xanthomonas campestris]|uniref:hypothetical protein n=1 Tax=Xanthomonas campestris TaxID=339 RepID=UPI002379C3DC|nr:hypothetical protein [Xanthomonas campestris]